MFTLNDDLSIYATRGDIVFFTVSAQEDGVAYKFKAGDVVRIKVFGKKDAESVVLQKDFPVTEESEKVEIFLSEEDTKLGEVISKPKDYWYEVELNPYNNPQTIIGYDEDGAKVFKLFPEGDDIPEFVPDPEDIRVMDDELDMASTRPVQNQAIARAVVSLRADFEETKEDITEKSNEATQAVVRVNGDIAVERARIDNLLSGATADDAEVVDARVGADGRVYVTAGDAARKQFSSANYARWLLDTFTTAKGKNLFDPDDPDIVYGGYYDGTNTYVQSGEYNQTGFIRVEENQIYTCSDKKRLVNWYAADKTFISTTDSMLFYATGYVTAPSGACYARFIGLVNEWDTFQVVSGTILPNYEAHSKIIDAAKLPESTRIIKPENTSFFKLGKNLFNPNDSDIIYGGYYKAGVYTESGEHNQTGYILIDAGEEYTCSCRIGFVDWFDDLKKYISTTASMDFANTGYVTAPDGARYARFVATVDAWDELQVEKGTSPTSYEAYSIKLPFNLVGHCPKDLPNCMLTTYGDSIVARNQWQPYVFNYFGMEHTNLGIGSTTMALVENVESGYPCMVNADRIQTVKDSNPDILVIMGGTNDCHRGVSVGTEEEFAKSLSAKDKTTFIGAYSYLIETLLTWKPTLQIVLMTPMHSSYELQYGYDYTDYSKAVRTVAEYYALNVADTSKKSGISKFDYTTYTTDGIHPNDAGAKNIANVVITTISNMNCV